MAVTDSNTYDQFDEVALDLIEIFKTEVMEKGQVGTAHKKILVFKEMLRTVMRTMIDTEEGSEKTMMVIGMIVNKFLGFKIELLQNPLKCKFFEMKYSKEDIGSVLSQSNGGLVRGYFWDFVFYNFACPAIKRSISGKEFAEYFY